MNCVHGNLDELFSHFEEIIDERDLNPDTRSEAQIILNSMPRFDFVCLLEYWVSVLRPIDRIQKRLQDPKIDFKNAAEDIEGLKIHFQSEKDTICSEAIEQAKEKCQSWGIAIGIDHRIRKKK